KGGRVLLTGRQSRDVFSQVVNNSGIISAGGIRTDGGVVRLVGAGGNTVNSGTIDVSGVHGGSAQLLSDRDVLVTDHARVDASGTRGGGHIRVGGGMQGGEGLVQAQRAYVAPDVALDAGARQRGNGGSIAVWST